MITNESLQEQIRSLATQVNQTASQVAQMSRPPVRENYWDKNFAVVVPVNTAEPGKRIPMAFSDPEMQRAYDAGEPFKTPDERRIEELERALAGMLYAYQDGDLADWKGVTENARTLVEAKEFKA